MTSSATASLVVSSMTVMLAVVVRDMSMRLNGIREELDGVWRKWTLFEAPYLSFYKSSRLQLLKMKDGDLRRMSASATKSGKSFRFHVLAPKRSRIVFGRLAIDNEPESENDSSEITRRIVWDPTVELQYLFTELPFGGSNMAGFLRSHGAIK